MKKPVPTSNDPARQFRGVWIPKAVWEAQSITWMEKCLLAEIDSLDDGQGCFASNDYLARKMGSTASSVANQVARLRKLGFIVDRSFDGRVRRISASHAPESKAAKKAIEAPEAQQETPAKEAADLTPELKQPSPPSEGTLNPPVTPYIGDQSEDQSVAPTASTGASPAGESEGGAKAEKAKGKEPSQEGLGFADFFNTLPGIAETRKGANWRKSWAIAYDQMIALDKRTKEEIVAVCRWANKDEFWKANLLSPVSLRERAKKGGAVKYDSILAKMRASGAMKTPAPKQAPCGASDFAPEKKHAFSVRAAQEQQQQNTTEETANEQSGSEPYEAF